MKTYEVDIEFKTAPSFSTTLLADNERDAKNVAQRLALQSGELRAPKTIRAREVGAAKTVLRQLAAGIIFTAGFFAAIGLTTDADADQKAAEHQAETRASMARQAKLQKMERHFDTILGLAR